MNEFMLLPKEGATPALSRRETSMETSAFADARPRRESRVAPPLASIRVARSPGVQAKLRVSEPGDGAEVEADRVADAVMLMPNPTSAGASASPSAARMPEEEEAARMPEDEEEVARAPEDEEEVARAPEDEEEVARAPEDEEEVARAPEDEEEVARAPEDEEKLDAARDASGGAPDVTPGVEGEIRDLHSGGAPLPEPTRQFFEPRLGTDLSGVRVQTGPKAASVARSLNARAFTVGNNITFGAGQYAPGSDRGNRLLAHELTHVIQQGGDKR